MQLISSVKGFGPIAQEWRRFGSNPALGAPVGEGMGNSPSGNVMARPTWLWYTRDHLGNI